MNTLFLMYATLSECLTTAWNRRRFWESIVRVSRDISGVENIVVAGIHIGDTRETVLSLLGEPRAKSFLPATPFPLWFYKEYNLYIAFYHSGGPNISLDAPTGGVVSIEVNEPSGIKTDRGFGIGSSLKDVMNSFEKAYAYENRDDTGTQYVVIKGSKLSGDMYYPTLGSVNAFSRNERSVFFMENCYKCGSP
ncbi:hypothetical protein [Brevibacillus borstelensis]|uniref:hypothetical protein n=1 Tax=Brevibacillus borstelensis TaxID=45462 RepID=UPI0030BECEAC